MSNNGCPVTVLWDIENCPVPPDSSGMTVVSTLRSFALRHGYLKTVSAIGTLQNIPDEVRAQLQSSGVSLHDVPPGSSTDVAILVELLKLVADNRPPHTIVLISGDRDFSNVLNVLVFRRYEVVLIHLPQASEVLKGAAKSAYEWASFLQTHLKDRPPTPPPMHADHPLENGHASAAHVSQLAARGPVDQASVAGVATNHVLSVSRGDHDRQFDGQLEHAIVREHAGLRDQLPHSPLPPPPREPALGRGDFGSRDHGPYDHSPRDRRQSVEHAGRDYDAHPSSLRDPRHPASQENQHHQFHNDMLGQHDLRHPQDPPPPPYHDHHMDHHFDYEHAHYEHAHMSQFMDHPAMGGPAMLSPSSSFGSVPPPLGMMPYGAMPPPMMPMKPAIRDFRPLMDAIRALQKTTAASITGIPPPPPDTIPILLTQLGSSRVPYLALGYKKLKDYIMDAAATGIVQIGGISPKEWVSLVQPMPPRGMPPLQHSLAMKKDTGGLTLDTLVSVLDILKKEGFKPTEWAIFGCLKRYVTSHHPKKPIFISEAMLNSLINAAAATPGFEVIGSKGNRVVYGPSGRFPGCDPNQPNDTYGPAFWINFRSFLRQVHPVSKKGRYAFAQYLKKKGTAEIKVRGRIHPTLSVSASVLWQSTSNSHGPLDSPFSFVNRHGFSLNNLFLFRKSAPELPTLNPRCACTN
eukprot:TRINITY_DN4578_c0_g1_i8.p1 TRINITY_DN4578_c0_g1~~TRINITY_DN4578_c0_g1_i8.p1  ORF type:complete len:689 (+),score=174.46 TRINITY_DN4578_c0_g1_i8:102-2168(+)